MKSRFLLFVSAIFLAGFASLLPLASHAARAETSTSPAAGSPSDADTAKFPGSSVRKMRAIPFRGVIASVDDKARTFTIAGKQTSRSLKITETTVITKAGQLATMKDIVANEEVRGSYYKMSDGSLAGKTVKVGPLTEAEKADKEARKERRQVRKAAASATP